MHDQVVAIIPLTQYSSWGHPLALHDDLPNLRELLSTLLPATVDASRALFLPADHCERFFIDIRRDAVNVVIIPRSLYVLTDGTINRPYGTITYTRTPKGVPAVQLKANNVIPRCKRDLAWLDSDETFFTRQDLSPVIEPEADEAIFISRWDSAFDPAPLQSFSSVWAAGITTWKKLVSQDVLVTGSSDGLGMQEIQYLPTGLCPQQLAILTHEGAPQRIGIRTIHQYKLVPHTRSPSLIGKTHFFWKSGSLFRHCLADNPQIRNEFHSCGPGETYETLRKEIPEDHIQIFLNFTDWKNEIVYATETTSEKSVLAAHP